MGEGGKKEYEWQKNWRWKEFECWKLIGIGRFRKESYDFEIEGGA
jgi:hypothetical protein